MIGIADTAEDIERRNSEGFPVVEAHVPANRGNFHQQVDQSRGKNDALPWVCFSWLLSGLALGCVIVMAILMPRIIDSKVSEGVAHAKAEMAQQAADAKAIANVGREHGRIALDKVEDFRTALAEKGINIELDGH
jgi:hypothetical protein